MNKKTLLIGLLSYGALASVAMLGTTACTVRARVRAPRPPRVTVRANIPPPPQAQVTVVQAAPPTVATGVTIIEASCTQGAQEVCNGLDDNCDGVIDEGCGYQTGNIQITLGWNTGADLDMYVTDPSGATIYYGDRQSATGGHLDQDARGACASGGGGAFNTENVYWDQPNPPQGNYAVEVDYWNGSRCSGQNGPTQFTLSVAVGGRVLGTWGNNLSPGQRVPVINFQI